MNEYIFIPCAERELFPYYQAKKLFNKYINEITENKLGFTGLLKDKKPYLWAVMVNDEFGGCYFIDSWISLEGVKIGGFAKRKHQEYSKESIKYFIDMLRSNGIQTIIAETKNRHTSIFLLKSGFKKIKENTYEVK